MPLSPEEEQRDEEARARHRAKRMLDDIYARWNTPPQERAMFRKETLRRLGLTEDQAVNRLATGVITIEQLRTDISFCFD